MSFPYLPTRWLVTGTPASDPNVFPLLPGQLFVSEKTPNWSTTTRKASSGRQVRASLQAAPIWTFKVGYDMLRKRPTKPELDTLYAFFNTRQGNFGTFFYYDPTDYTVVNQPTGTGDGTKTAFQLSRTVAPGTIYAVQEPIYAVLGQPTVFVNGAITPVTVSAYGVITFAAAPANGAVITWSGQFMYWCHFIDDKISPAQFASDMWSLDGVSFESLLP